MSVRIMMAQMQLKVGDIAGNAEKIVRLIEKAGRENVHILLTPELSICGYPPEDLLEREEFFVQCEEGLERLIEASKNAPGVAVLAGFPEKSGGKVYNAAAVIKNGAAIGIYRKECLPNYGVFDERRYFQIFPNPQPFVFEEGGIRFGVCICEDVWNELPAKRAKEAGADVLLVLNASPYEGGKLSSRLKVLEKNVLSLGLPVVYVNEAGAQDEILFDGRSLVIDSCGIKELLPAFEEETRIIEMNKDGTASASLGLPPEGLEEIYKGLVTGLRNYHDSNGFKGIVLGLSGGIDSAVVAKLAVDAVGKDKVEAIMMPSRYTADISKTDAGQLARNLGIKYHEIPIAPAFGAFTEMLEERFRGFEPDVTEENLQARIRGTLLMAVSNKTGSLVTATGNKSEMAVGYSTLYGDLAGGFAPIKDVWKTQIFELAKWINQREGKEVIPERIITRPPSAELREGQKDEDSLPPYPVLDAILKAYVEEGETPEAIIAKGFDPAVVKKVLQMLQKAEYKRRQSPIGTKISPVAFGRDWRYPVTNGYKPCSDAKLDGN